jgi:hypothetical protein
LPLMGFGGKHNSFGKSGCHGDSFMGKRCNLTRATFMPT